MVSYNWNGHLLNQLPVEVSEFTRAWQYADSLFESMRMSHGRIPWLSQHMARLHGGMAALGFQIPDHWHSSFWYAEIQKIALGNHRVRLQVWRATGGRYLPSDNQPHFMLQAEPLDDAVFAWPAQGISLGVSTRVRLPVDDFSPYKTLNAARYVVAALEAQEKGWDDAVLLNCHERVCEATSSNVFWWEGSNLYTTPLDDGCVAGICRNKIIQIAAQSGLGVLEKGASFATLATADEIFLSNAVRGIIPVRHFQDAVLPNSKTKRFFDQLCAAFLS